MNLKRPGNPPGRQSQTGRKSVENETLNPKTSGAVAPDKNSCMADSKGYGDGLRPPPLPLPVAAGQRNYLPQYLFPRPFADLHVAHVGAVDDQPHGRAHLVQPVLPGGAGVDVQQVVDGVVDHLEDVRVPGDKELGP